MSQDSSPALFWPPPADRNPVILKKSLYAVTEVLQGDSKRTTMACVVQERNSVKYQLVTWRKAEQNDAIDITADCYCRKHVKKHRITIDSPLEGTGLTFIPLKHEPDEHLKLVGQNMLKKEQREQIKQRCSAHTFFKGAVVQLDFRKSQEKYELTDPHKEGFDKVSAIGAPIIFEVNHKVVVIGVLGLFHGELHPVFLKETGIGEYTFLLSLKFPSGNDKLNCLKEAPKVYLITKRNS